MAEIFLKTGSSRKISKTKGTEEFKPVVNKATERLHSEMSKLPIKPINHKIEKPNIKKDKSKGNVFLPISIIFIIYLGLSFNFLRRKNEMKSDGTTGVTPKNEKTIDFMKKMLSAITKTSQKPKVPVVLPFKKKKPSILVNSDGIHAHKVMSVTQIKTDIKKVLDKNDQKNVPDLKISEKEIVKENTIQKRVRKRVTFWASV